MREIKFRAWGYDGSHIGKKDMFIPYCEEFNDINDSISNLQDEEIVLMQYTGLKDKNGVEIYEGDIMVLNKMKPSYYVVKYLENNFVLDGVSLFDNSSYFTEREVIGNIYENKELLDEN